MNTPHALPEAMEQVSLILEELVLSSGMFYQSLAPTMAALRSGRSLKSVSLEEKLRQPQDFLSVFQQILPELEKLISQLKNTGEKVFTEETATSFRAMLSGLEYELAFYRRFLEVSVILIQKLHLISKEDRLGPLGQLPINEAWQQIEQMAGRV
jgi:hypothetical protein